MSLTRNELENTIRPHISIDEFEPKLGDTSEVIVVAFYASDEAPAKDLNTFIQRGTFDVLDADVSPNPDEDGDYLIFVEFERNEEFYEVFTKFLTDIENLTGEQEWVIKPYLADHAFSLDDPDLAGYIITDPGSYVDKKEFDKVMDIDESIKILFTDSMIKDLTITENYVIFTGLQRIAANIVDLGKDDEIYAKHRLASKSINLSPKSEVIELNRMLGESWNVHELDDVIAIEGQSEQLLLLNNIQYIYG